jgi:hypothetical protein
MSLLDNSIKRLRDAGYAIESASEKVIKVVYLSFTIQKDTVIFYPQTTSISNNQKSVTKFLNHHGGVNNGEHREKLEQYDKYIEEQ